MRGARASDRWRVARAGSRDPRGGPAPGGGGAWFPRKRAPPGSRGLLARLLPRRAGEGGGPPRAEARARQP
eukprot:1473664-Pyramimonas_sp.AAC.1